MISHVARQKIAVKAKKPLKQIFYSHPASENRDFIALVETKLFTVNSKGELKSVGAYDDLKVIRSTDSADGTRMVSSLMDGKICIWEKGSKSVRLISAPPGGIVSTPGGTPRQAHGCCFPMSPIRFGVIGQHIFVNNRGTLVLTVTSDGNLWLWRGGDVGTAGWHLIPAERLGLGRPIDAQDFHAVFAENAQGDDTASLVLVAATDNMITERTEIEFRMMTLSFGPSAFGVSWDIDWTIVTADWGAFPSRVECLSAQWDPTGTLLAVTVAEQSVSYVVFASASSSEIQRINLTVHEGMDEFQPRELCWIAGGALLAISDQFGRVCVVSRLGAPLGLVDSVGSGTSTCVRGLGAHELNSGAALVPHPIAGSFVMHSSTSAVSIDLPFKDARAAIEELAASGQKDPVLALCAWRAGISLPTIEADTVMIKAGFALTEAAGNNWASAVLALQSLKWDTEVKFRGAALALAADAVETLLANRRPLLAAFVVTLAERAFNAHLRAFAMDLMPTNSGRKKSRRSLLQDDESTTLAGPSAAETMRGGAIPYPPVQFRKLWKRIAMDAQAAGDLATVIATAQKLGLKKISSTPSTSLSSSSPLYQAHALWMMGNYESAIDAYRSLGVVGAAPLMCTLLLQYEIPQAMDLARLQMKDSTITGSKKAVQILASAMSAYFGHLPITVPYPSCCNSESSTAIARTLELDRTMLSRGAQDVSDWTAKTASQYMLALGSVRAAAAVLARADDRAGAVALTLVHDLHGSGAATVLGFARECIQKQQFGEAAAVIAAAECAQLDTLSLQRDAVKACVAAMQTKSQQLPLFTTNLALVDPIKLDIKRLSDHAILLSKSAVLCLQAYVDFLKHSRPVEGNQSTSFDAVEQASLKTMCRLLWCVREREQLVVGIVKKSEEVAVRAARVAQFADLLSPTPSVIEGCLALIDADFVPLESVKLIIRSLAGHSLGGATRIMFLRFVDNIRKRDPDLAEQLLAAPQQPAPVDPICESDPRFAIFIQRIIKSAMEIAPPPAPVDLPAPVAQAVEAIMNRPRSNSFADRKMPNLRRRQTLPETIPILTSSDPSRSPRDAVDTTAPAGKLEVPTRRLLKVRTPPSIPNPSAPTTSTGAAASQYAEAISPAVSQTTSTQQARLLRLPLRTGMTSPGQRFESAPESPPIEERRDSLTPRVSSRPSVSPRGSVADALTRVNSAKISPAVRPMRMKRTASLSPLDVSQESMILATPPRSRRSSIASIASAKSTEKAAADKPILSLPKPVTLMRSRSNSQKLIVVNATAPAKKPILQLRAAVEQAATIRAHMSSPNLLEDAATSPIPIEINLESSHAVETGVQTLLSPESQLAVDDTMQPVSPSETGSTSPRSPTTSTFRLRKRETLNASEAVTPMDSPRVIVPTPVWGSPRSPLHESNSPRAALQMDLPRPRSVSQIITGSPHSQHSGSPRQLPTPLFHRVFEDALGVTATAAKLSPTSALNPPHINSRPSSPSPSADAALLKRLPSIREVVEPLALPDMEMHADSPAFEAFDDQVTSTSAVQSAAPSPIDDRKNAFTAVEEAERQELQQVPTHDYDADSDVEDVTAFAPAVSAQMMLRMDMTEGPRQFLSVVDLDEKNFPISDRVSYPQDPVGGVQELPRSASQRSMALFREKVALIASRLDEAASQAQKLENDMSETRKQFAHRDPHLGAKTLNAVKRVTEVEKRIKSSEERDRELKERLDRLAKQAQVQQSSEKE